MAVSFDLRFPFSIYGFPRFFGRVHLGLFALFDSNFLEMKPVLEVPSVYNERIGKREPCCWGSLLATLCGSERPIYSISSSFGQYIQIFTISI